MYWPQIGRFISADSVMGSPGNPMTLNRYSYVLNNPYKYVDPTGRWPTDTHNAIIDYAFPAMSSSQRQILKDGSAYTDRPGGQLRDNWHSMRASGQSPEQAKAAIATRIANGEAEAGAYVKANGGKIEPGLREWASTNHTVMDGTSPVHVDEQGNPLKVDWLKIGEHVAGEKSISPGQMQKSVDASRASFERAFGKEALNDAMGVCR